MLAIDKLLTLNINKIIEILEQLAACKIELLNTGQTLSHYIAR